MNRRLAAISVRDRQKCPVWKTADGVRHIRLPNGLVWSADEEKLAGVAVDAYGGGDEFTISVVERMTTPEERAVLAEIVSEVAKAALADAQAAQDEQAERTPG